ncbi:isoprenylcysteine carboxyl methyltransferase family protein [Laceyella putida]|uniref:Isoprenylcysteine carboxyl methyltransferase family protein n=1 Tax=Laceyella putida TaxID=110101 RepID=A0ABW2RQF7_9BACL
MNRLEWGILLFVIVQRVGECWLAERHTRWMKKRGAVEFGRRHYPLLVLVHALLFVGMGVECLVFGATPPAWWAIPFLLFVLAQGVRIWCIRSLGRYWNTRILLIPGQEPQVKGPYKYIRHPNYLVVIIELICLPLMLGAVVTMMVVSALNALVLFRVRIPAEEQAWSEWTHYEEWMPTRRM